MFDNVIRSNLLVRFRSENIVNCGRLEGSSTPYADRVEMMHVGIILAHP